MAHGNHPLHGISGSDGMTLGMFIADAYTTWVNAGRPRTAANTLEKLHRHFRTWYPEPLTAITVERVESWKARHLGEGRSPSTVRRDLFTLSSVLRRAVKAGELPSILLWPSRMALLLVTFGLSNRWKGGNGTLDPGTMSDVGRTNRSRVCSQDQGGEAASKRLQRNNHPT